MKVLIFALFFVSFFGHAKSACLCYLDQNVTSTAAAVSINSPTTTGSFGGEPCGPINCTTTVTFFGNLPNGLPAGAIITVLQCTNLSSDNQMIINNQLFNSCSSDIFKFSIVDTNVIKINFQIQTPISLLIVLQPTEQITPTTTSPMSTTTAVYSGPFKYDPSTARMDLTIGLDLSEGSMKYYNYSSETISKIANYFTYSHDLIRLSFISFDSQAITGTGEFNLWSLNSTILQTVLNNLPIFPSNNSDYNDTLIKYFFNKLITPHGAVRYETELIFIIFTATDSMPAEDNFTDINIQIDEFDIKFIFVNMNPNVATFDFNNFPYPELKKITGTGSNKAHWFDYKLNQNNADNILSQLYFNGNALCNRPSKNITNLTPHSGPVNYSIPQDQTKRYCNYMKNTQIYASTYSSYAVSVIIKHYDLSDGLDFLIIFANGKEVDRLTGKGQNKKYCFKDSSVAITLETKNGLVFNGYESQVQVVDVSECSSDSEL